MLPHHSTVFIHNSRLAQIADVRFPKTVADNLEEAYTPRFSITTILHEYPDLPKEVEEVLIKLDDMTQPLRFPSSQDHWLAAYCFAGDKTAKEEIVFRLQRNLSNIYGVDDDPNDPPIPLIPNIIPPIDQTAINDHLRHYLNLSEVLTDRWVRTVISVLEKSSQKRIAIFLGKEGSGKSAFFKFVLRTRADAFWNSRIIPLRVEYSKFEKALHSSSVTSASRFQAYNGDIDKYAARAVVTEIGQCIARDVFLMKFSQYFNDLGRAELSGELRDFVGALVKNRVKERDFTKYIRDSLEMDILQLSTYALHFDDEKFFSVSRLLKQCLVADALTKGYEILLIFDGFDTISFEEHITGPSKIRLLLAFARLFDLGKALNYVEDMGFVIRPHIWMVLRDSTALLHFTSGFSDAYKKYVSDYLWRIGTPTASNLVSGRINLTFSSPKNNAPDNELHNGITSIINLAGKAINETLSLNQKSLTTIFNADCRRVLDFTHAVVMFLLERTLKHQGKVNSVSDLVAKLKSELTEVVSSKRYLLSEMILLRNQKRFHNWVVEGKRAPLDRDVIEFTLANRSYLDQAKIAGFIDNIFQYLHFPGQRPVAPNRNRLLIKLHFCQIITTFGKMTLDAIRKHLRVEFQYELSDEDFLLLSASLIKAGFIELCLTVDDARGGEFPLQEPTTNPNLLATRLAEFGNAPITISQKGQYVIDHLIYQLSYIENVFHRTLLPEWIIRKSDIGLKYVNGDHWWAAISVVNAFRFLTAVYSIEKNMNLLGTGYSIYERMYQGVNASISRMTGADKTGEMDVWVADQIQALVNSWAKPLPPSSEMRW
jgi:hypothetical protein